MVRDRVQRLAQSQRGASSTENFVAGFTPPSDHTDTSAENPGVGGSIPPLATSSGIASQGLCCEFLTRSNTPPHLRRVFFPLCVRCSEDRLSTALQALQMCAHGQYGRIMQV